MGVKTRIVRIGNSRGIRIPKAILDQAGFGEEVELEVADGQLIISAIGPPREGWDESFRAMAERGDDPLSEAVNVHTSSWDEDEWEW